MKKTQLRLAIPMAVLTTLALAGCSDDSDSSPSGGESASSSAGATDTPSTPAVDEKPVDLGPEPPTVRAGAGAVKDVELGECATEEGDQTADGTVTNSTARATSYLIVINWINDTSSVRGRGFTVVRNLAAGESADWEIDGTVGSGATQCALNVMRGRVGN